MEHEHASVPECTQTHTHTDTHHCRRQQEERENT